MPRLLVLSVATLNQPHRRPYEVLARRGWEVHLVAPERLDFGSGQVQACAPAAWNAASTLHTLPIVSYAQQRLSWFRGLPSLMRRVRPDVVFAEYDPGSVMAVGASALGRALGSKVVCFTVENIARDRAREALSHLAGRRGREAARDSLVAGLSLAGERAISGLACISRDGERIFEERRFRKPMAVMPLGTDCELFRPRDGELRRAALGLPLPSEGFVVGYFGRLVPEKGCDLIIEALAQLPDDVRLLLDMYRVFVPGSYGGRLLQRARQLGVASRIVTIDVPHGEVPLYMSCCDAVALPSRSTERWKEQFGRVVPEAMACGVPVIGSRSGSIPDLIGDAGLLVEEGSAPALAEAIRALRDDPERRRALGEAGRARVLAHFSVEAQVEILDGLLRRVLA